MAEVLMGQTPSPSVRLSKHMVMTHCLPAALPCFKGADNFKLGGSGSVRLEVGAASHPG